MKNEEYYEVFEGGWYPIKDIKDPHLEVIAKFAISEYNKQNNSRLKFQTVVSGDKQVVGGINYRLVLDVIDGCNEGSMIYEAEVFEKIWLDFMELNYFKPIN
ncbi:Cysteine proteinase inhibitor 5 [Raphanus sativus]|nr:Cysteine proteinase inhibitor 5 [Raphanus sativus]